MPRVEELLSIKEMRRKGRRRDLMWERRNSGINTQEERARRGSHYQHHLRGEVAGSGRIDDFDEKVAGTWSAGIGNVKVEVATTTTTTGDGGDNDQEDDYFGVGGWFPPVEVELAEKGNEQECLICCGRLEVRDLSRGINFGGGRSRAEECDQLKSQLWAMFVLRRVLGFPEEECARLLQLSFGLNPHDWFDLCGGCSEVVEAVLEMQEQVRVLEGKMKDLRIGLKSKLEGNLRVEKKKKGSSEDSADSEEVGVVQIRDEIRKYFKGQLVFPKPQRPKRTRRGHSTTGGRRDHDDDDDGANSCSSSGSNDSDYNDNPENDPSWTDDDEGEGEYGGRGGVGVSRSPSPDDEGACKSKDRGKKGHYSCSICSLPYSNSIRLGYHMRKYHRNGEPAAVPSIQCAHCPAKLLNLYAVNLHNRKEHPELYKACCELCDFVGKSSSQLRQHRKSKHRENDGEKDNNRCSTTTTMFQCEQCDASFDKQTKLEVHLGAMHENEVKTCDTCGVEVRLSSYRRHLIACKKEERNKRRSSHQAEQFNCDKCGHLTTNRGHWLLHLQTHEYDDHMEFTSSGAFQCKTCSAVLSTKLQIQKHLREAHQAELGLALHQCDGCGKTFGSAKTLGSHVRNVHANQRKLEQDVVRIRNLELADNNATTTSTTGEHSTSTPSHNCDICGLSYVSKYRLDGHRRYFHNFYVKKKGGGGDGGGGSQAVAVERPLLKCDYCESTFINIYAKRLHFRASHPEVFKFKCDLCSDYAGRTADNVFQHKKLKHSAVKRAKCPYCAQDYHLNSIYSHKAICAKKLGIPEELEEPKKKYRKLGGRRVSCKVCSASFKTAKEANLHNRAEHGDVYCHFCDECDYVAKSTANVARHKRYVHEGAECPYCQEEIPTLPQFYHHKRKCRKQLGLINNIEKTKRMRMIDGDSD